MTSKAEMSLDEKYESMKAKQNMEATQSWLIGQRIIAKVDQALDDLWRELAIEQVIADAREGTPDESDSFDSEINRMENSDWGYELYEQRQAVEAAVRKVLPQSARPQPKRSAG